MELAKDPLSKLNTKTGNTLVIGIRFSQPCVKEVKKPDKTFSIFKVHVVDEFWDYCGIECFAFGTEEVRTKIIDSLKKLMPAGKTFNISTFQR